MIAVLIRKQRLGYSLTFNTVGSMVRRPEIKRAFHIWMIRPVELWGWFLADVFLTEDIVEIGEDRQILGTFVVQDVDSRLEASLLMG